MSRRLCYCATLLGCKHSRENVARLARALPQSRGEVPLRVWLGSPAMGMPIAFVQDPVHPGICNALGRHLHYAAMVAEASPHPGAPPGAAGALWQLACEAAVLPVRLFLGRA